MIAIFIKTGQGHRVTAYPCSKFIFKALTGVFPYENGKLLLDIHIHIEWRPELKQGIYLYDKHGNHVAEKLTHTSYVYDED